MPEITGIGDPTRKWEPVVNTVRKDVVLIGTAHGQYFEDRAREIRRLVNGSRYLLMEGSQATVDMVLADVSTGQWVPGHEDEAIRLFRNRKRDIIPLEEGSSTIQLGVNNGVTLGEEVLGYVAGQHILYANSKDRFPTIDELKENLSEDQFFKGMTDEEIYGYVDRARGAFRDGFRSRRNPLNKDKVGIIGGFHALFAYENMLRDSVIAPNALSHANRLGGKKSIMVGKDHLGALQTVFSGGTLEPPRPWLEYAQGLSSKERSGVDVFRRYAVRI